MPVCGEQNHLRDVLPVLSVQTDHLPTKVRKIIDDDDDDEGFQPMRAFKTYDLVRRGI